MDLIWQESNHYKYGDLTIIIKNVHMRHTQQGLFKFNEYYCDMEVNGEIFKDTQITFPLTETGIKEGDYCYAACVRLKTSEPFFLQNFKELV